MLHSHSYHVAIRRISTTIPHIQPHLSASNEFISINPKKLEQEPQENLADPSATLENQRTPWPRALRELAVKDNIVTAELPTTCGSGILKEHQSPFEATVVEQFRKLGSSVTGKANLDEFGMGSHSMNSFFGQVRNDSSAGGRSVGGSSGGSAVAVAKGRSQFALGTDTGGSVRLPAAYTGIVGFKPSYGLISRWGVVPYANSLDTVGILVPKANLLNDILHNIRHHDPKDPTSVTTSAWERMRHRAATSPGARLSAKYFANFKIGVPIEYNIVELDPGVRQAWSDALAVIQDIGATIVPVSLPNTKYALSAYYVLAPAEAASNLSKYDGVRYGSRRATADGSGNVLYSETRAAGFGDEVKRRILLGSYTLSSTAIDNYFIKAQKVRRLVQRDFDRVFSVPNPLHPDQQFDLSELDESVLLDNKLGPSQVDMIICPTAPTPPPTVDEVSKQSTVDTYMNDVFTVPASLAGLPALSLPCPIPKEYQQPDAPVFAGLQIIGQYGDDFRVIETAKRLERLLYPEEAIKSKKSRLRRTIPDKEEPKDRESKKEKSQIRKIVTSKPMISYVFMSHPLIKKVGHDDPMSRVLTESGRSLIKTFKSSFNPVREVEIATKSGRPLINTFVTGKGETKFRDPVTNNEVTKQLDDALAFWSPGLAGGTSSQSEAEIGGNEAQEDADHMK